MSVEIVDDDEGGFTNDDFDPNVDNSIPTLSEQSNARRRIEELMERRRLKRLIEDPYRDDFDADL